MENKSNTVNHETGSVLRKGYGSIPKLVMQDTRLSIEAKSIYAYIASYAGNGDSAFPGIDLMVKHLGIGEKRLYKHRKQLIDLGYITITHTRNEDGTKRGVNIYTLNQIIHEHSQNDSIDIDSQHSRFEHVQNQPGRFEHVQNGGYNNNSILNNNSINNNNNNKKEQEPVVVEKKEEVEKVIKALDKKVDYVSAKTILKKAKGDMELIKNKYEVAKATGYNNLGGFMVKAIEEDWQMPVSESPKGNRSKNNTFHNFDQRSSKYTDDDLKEILKKKKASRG